jgi:hypothetical protein
MQPNAFPFWKFYDDEYFATFDEEKILCGAFFFRRGHARGTCVKDTVFFFFVQPIHSKKEKENTQKHTQKKCRPKFPKKGRKKNREKKTRKSNYFQKIES